MSRNRMKLGLVEVLGYLMGAVMLLPLGVRSADAPRTPLSLDLGLAATGLIIITGAFTFLGNRRIPLVGVSREGGAVVCRFVPWYELNVYVIFLVMPLFAIAAIAHGRQPGRPVWLVYTGLIILGCVAIAGYFVAQMWRRSLLRFSRAALTVGLPARGSQLIEIPRSGVESITDAQAEVGAAFAPATVTQIAIAYRPVGSGAATTVLIGPPASKTALQVSVHQPNMLTALLHWQQGDPNDPGLMDRVEAILRGRAGGVP